MTSIALSVALCMPMTASADPTAMNADETAVQQTELSAPADQDAVAAVPSDEFATGAEDVVLPEQEPADTEADGSSAEDADVAAQPEADAGEGVAVLSDDGIAPAAAPRMVSREYYDGKYWYYYNDKGAMVKDDFVLLQDQAAPGGKKWVYYDASGHMLYGEQYINGGWYYLNPYTGAVTYDFVLLDVKASEGGGKKWVYYGPYMADGRMRYGEQYINGGWYYLNPYTGAVTYDFVLLEDKSAEGGKKWVYYGPYMGDGRMRYGEQYINGGWYYLTPGTGAVDYEWALIPTSNGGTKWVYYGPYMGDGRMRYGKQVIDGEKYRFNMNTGEVCTYFRLYLDAGHGQDSSGNGAFDAGAVGSGYREANLTSELVDLVAAECRNRYGLDVVVNKDGYYRDRQSEARALGCSTIVSIHFNSGGGSGYESYIHSTNAHAGSAALQDHIHPALGLACGGQLRDRGQQKAALALCANYMPATLLEIGFIDNAYDMSVYQAHKADYARYLAAAIYEASKDDACIQ